MFEGAPAPRAIKQQPRALAFARTRLGQKMVIIVVRKSLWQEIPKSPAVEPMLLIAPLFVFWIRCQQTKGHKTCYTFCGQLLLKYKNT